MAAAASKKKACELCGKAARMLCESDQATLCWDCDEKVHAANFLVAKHSRTLLCHICYSPTPWKAAGPKLGPTVSVCRACAETRDFSSRGRRDNEEEEEIAEDGCDSAESESDGGEYYRDSEDDYSSSDDDDEDEEEEEEGENQVVPWAESPVSPSRSEENLTLSSSYKRTRGHTPLESEDEDVCSSSHQDFEFKIDAHARRLKTRRMSNDVNDELTLPEERQAGSTSSLGTAAIVEKLLRFQQQGIVTEEEEEGTSAVVLDLCKLTRY